MFSLERVNKHLSNIIGWSSGRKIVVIESDDWGSIRMPSRQAYERLVKLGVPVNVGESNRYNLFDGLASADDLETMFSMLLKFRDRNGRNPVFTALSLVANPDFEKIRKENFEEYYFEPFTDTLKRFGLESSIVLWKQGIESGLFIPQFHGREHLNVKVWMRALQAGDKLTIDGFNEDFWGFRNKQYTPINYQAAFDLQLPEDIVAQQEVISTGLNLFSRLHGYDATFFVPPNGPFNRALSEISNVNGIKYMSTAKKHLEPLGNNKFKKSYHYLGQKNKVGQIYITRNCSFEPSAAGIDWVGSCLNEINTAFLWKKPAIISTHRVNYIGLHDKKNRENGIMQLEILLEKMLKNWPDIEFYSSNELGDLIAKKGKYAVHN